MPADVYEVISLAMRYVFTLFGVMIVWRAFSWLRKDRRLKHKRLKQLPDAGTIGILVVEQGSPELKEGTIIPVPHEGVLGYLRTCDMVVPAEGVANQHLDFIFRDGYGLYIYPRRGCECAVDGVPLRSRRDSRTYPMQHNSTLAIGQAVLRLGVFAGLDVAQYMGDLPDEAPVTYNDPLRPEMPPIHPPQPVQQPFYPQHIPYPQQPGGVNPPPYSQQPVWPQEAPDTTRRGPYEP